MVTGSRLIKTAAEVFFRQPGCLLVNRPLTLRPQLTMGLPFRCTYFVHIYIVIPAFSPITKPFISDVRVDGSQSLNIRPRLRIDSFVDKYYN